MAPARRPELSLSSIRVATPFTPERHHGRSPRCLSLSGHSQAGVPIGARFGVAGSQKHQGDREALIAVGASAALL
jgi:hypothetical protein